VLHKLENIEVPTLVMAGRYDWITPPTREQNASMRRYQTQSWSF